MARFVRFDMGGRIRHGEVRGDKVHPLDGEIGSFRPAEGAPLEFSAITLLAATMPQKIVAVGPNYLAHYKKGGTPPDRPFYWIKPSSAVLAPEGVIELPSTPPMVCHESELAIVIGKVAKDVKVSDAAGYIFGYTCINDVSAGDLTNPLELRNTQWFTDGKIFDTFAPIGPQIVTDIDANNLKVECRVNGQVRQSHHTSDFIWKPVELVAMISSVLTLYPGDVIATGSPPGMGPLVHGDTVEIEVENIGILRNHVRRKS